MLVPVNLGYRLPEGQVKLIDFFEPCHVKLIHSIILVQFRTSLSGVHFSRKPLQCFCKCSKIWVVFSLLEKLVKTVHVDLRPSGPARACWGFFFVFF